MKFFRLFIVLALIVLAIGFFSSGKTTPQTPPAKQVKQKVQSFNLVVKDNKLVSGPSVLKANQGDIVEITITADVDGELHLHGYDKHVDFKKDKPAVLGLTANISGRFPYELEDTKTEIGALEVQPK